MKHNRILSLLFKEQKGTAMILVALCMFMLIGFTAIVVDAGALYLEKSRLQKALDAAVLGGAQKLKDSPAEAESTAIELADKNGFQVDGSEVYADSNFIEIDKTVKKPLTFARIFGVSEADVRAYAKAKIFGLTKGVGVVPVGMELEEYQPGQPYIMHFEPGSEEKGPYSGNFGFLGLDGAGGKVLEESIKHGSQKGVTEEYEWSEPGISWGNVKSGFDYRIKQDEGKEHCQSHETADKTCERVIVVPIVETFQVSGKSMVRIMGFAAFWIESVTQQPKQVTGRFIDKFDSEGEFEEEDDFGVIGVKLVN